MIIWNEDYLPTDDGEELCQKHAGVQHTACSMQRIPRCMIRAHTHADVTDG
jgi:hypothetical protein